MVSAGEHHLHKRKRTYKKLQPLPHPNPFKRFMDYVMSVVAFVAPFALVPQVYKVYTYQDVGDLSIETWVMLAFFNVLWTTYGLLHKAPPVVISSALTGLLQVSLVVAIFIFG